MEYLPIVAIFGIGLIANVAMRKTSSRAVKILIGVPAMTVIMVLFLRWM